MHLHSHSELLATRPRWTVRLRLTVLYGALFLLSGAGLLAITDTLASNGPVVVHLVPGPNGSRPSVSNPAANQGQSAGGLTPGQKAAEVHHLIVVSAIALAIMAVISIVLGWIVAGRVLRPLRTMTTVARRISEDNLHERLAVPGPSDELKDLGDTIDGLLERLEDAFAAQRQFVSYASHELRTPLTLARTLLEMTLSDPQPTVAAFRKTCEEVLAAGIQQERLIEALLTLAHSQRGLDRREPVDLAAVVTKVLRAHEPDATHRGLEMLASISTAPTLGDASLLERLADNLVENALRYNVPHGLMNIQVGVYGGLPTLTISNTGPVIPASQTSRLLQPFQRMPASQSAAGQSAAGQSAAGQSAAGQSADEQSADDTASWSAEDMGLGLGLSIVTAITKAHRATLTANPGPHGGLDIQIRFPAVDAAITGSTWQGTSQVRTTAGARPH